MDDLHNEFVALSYKLNRTNMIITLKPRFECMCHDSKYECDHYHNYQLAKEDYFAKLKMFEHFNKKEV